MRLSASSGGISLGPWRRDMVRRLERAAQRSTDRASIGAQRDYRSAMRGQRLGGLANAIKQTSDLKKSRLKRTADGGFSASGVVYAHIRSERTKGALEAYTQGATIVPRKGGWLAIATNEIPRLVGRFRMTPALYMKHGFDRRIGPLRFAPGKSGHEAFLVVDDVTTSKFRTGSAKRATRAKRATNRERRGIVAFVLIKNTRRNRRLNVAEIARRWQDKVPGFLQSELA